MKIMKPVLKLFIFLAVTQGSGYALSFPIKIDQEISPFIAHVHMLQELKERFNKITTDLTASTNNSKKRLTQTEAYLSVYQDEVNNSFGDYLDKYKDVITSVIAKEQHFAETHYVFYHAHDIQLIILQDFMRLLDEYLRLIKVRSDFISLRLKDVHKTSYKNAQEYITMNSYIDDHDTETQSQMISVNLSLFGNHLDKGECTFAYFLYNRSISVCIEDRLKAIFIHYNFPEKYIDDLIDLAPLLNTTKGSLLQIFVPHDMVNNLLYLSKPYGKPYQGIILDGIEYAHHEKSMQSLIEYMCTSPERITNLHEWQGRLLFLDSLLDMHPDIKFFRYHTVSDENMKQYQKKLRKIVIKVVIDYLKIYNIQDKKPFYQLYQYMFLNNQQNTLNNVNSTVDYFDKPEF